MITRLKSHIILFVLVFVLPSYTAFKAMQLIDSGEVIPNDFAESELPFILEGHPILIKARLNNSQKEYSLIFDTGALTMIKQEVAKELNLPKGIEVEANDTGGKSKTIDLVKLDNIIVGNMEVRDCAVGESDFSGIFSSNIAGILGSNYFKHFKVIIDYRNKKVTFSRENKQTAVQDKEIIIPFESDMKMGFAPVIKCEVDGALKDTAVMIQGSRVLSLYLYPWSKKPFHLKRGT